MYTSKCTKKFTGLCICHTSIISFTIPRLLKVSEVGDTFLKMYFLILKVEKSRNYIASSLERWSS